MPHTSRGAPSAARGARAWPAAARHRTTLASRGGGRHPDTAAAWPGTDQPTRPPSRARAAASLRPSRLQGGGRPRRMVGEGGGGALAPPSTATMSAAHSQNRGARSTGRGGAAEGVGSRTARHAASSDASEPNDGKERVAARPGGGVGAEGGSVVVRGRCVGREGCGRRLEECGWGGGRTKKARRTAASRRARRRRRLAKFPPRPFIDTRLALRSPTPT